VDLVTWNTDEFDSVVLIDITKHSLLKISENF